MPKKFPKPEDVLAWLLVAYLGAGVLFLLILVLAIGKVMFYGQ